MSAGDLLESEQNASVQLRKELADLEKQVEQLQGSNESLEKQVGLYVCVCGWVGAWMHAEGEILKLQASDTWVSGACIIYCVLMLCVTRVASATH